MEESLQASEPALLSRKPLLAVVFLALASVWGGLLTIREPLWIDELHTYWACNDTLANVAERARFGNQSPLWFWCDAIWYKLLGDAQVSPVVRQAWLRLPSLACWFATFLIIGLWLTRYARGNRSNRVSLLSALFSLAMLLVCDQLDWFYAIEARPYSAVCLLITIAALCQRRVFWGTKTLQRWLYVASATTAVYVHYTAIMLVCLLWLGDLISHDRSSASKRALRSSFIDILLILVLTIPALGELLSIGRSRHLWNSFAGQTNFANIRALLPLDCWLGIVIFFWATKTRGKIWDAATAFAFHLAIICCICVLAVWTMGAMGVAPLIHSRYVLGCYPLICLAVGVFLIQLKSRIVILFAACVMAVAWMLTQGGPMFLRYHMPIVWQRYEDWPTAVQAVQKQLSADGVRLAFAPMLVETASTESINQYGQKNLWYGWIAASSLYGVQTDNAVPANSVLLSNAVDRWVDELNLITTDSTNIVVIARAHAASIEPRLEQQLAAKSQFRFALERLFGNAAERLCVFRIQKIQ
jgi:hypothetical protein